MLWLCSKYVTLHSDFFSFSFLVHKSSILSHSDWADKKIEEKDHVIHSLKKENDAITESLKVAEGKVEEIHSLKKENYGLSQSLKVAEGKVTKIKNIANEKIKKAEEKAKEKDSIIHYLKEEAEKKDALIKSLTQYLQVAEGRIKKAEEKDSIIPKAQKRDAVIKSLKGRAEGRIKKAEIRIDTA